MTEQDQEKRYPIPLVDKDWVGGTALSIPMFPAIVGLFVGSSDDMFKYYAGVKDHSLLRMLAKERLDSYSDADKGWVFIEGAESIIRLRRLDLSDMKCVGTLYHEALHVALDIVLRVGLEVGRNGEILAYLQGYIVEKLLDELRNGDYGTLLPDGTKIKVIRSGGQQ